MVGYEVDPKLRSGGVRQARIWLAHPLASMRVLIRVITVRGSHYDLGPVANKTSGLAASQRDTGELGVVLLCVSLTSVGGFYRRSVK